MIKLHTIALLAAMLVSCTGFQEFALKQKERQMELIARDWSMTIRASQVVPVYPLTQDFQPGDVFLVDRSIAKQSATYRDRGFLPTDLRLTRLNPDSYPQSYESWTGTRPNRLTLPAEWRESGADVPWNKFPKAGFPSYSFKVSNSGGLSVAIPVQSVPFALSITGAASATGSITIADAITYGVDATSLYEQLQEAARTGRFDAAKPNPDGPPRYLRVVTRVFAAKSFEVVLSATSTMGGGIDAGASQPVSDTSNQLENGLSVDQINQNLKQLGAATDAAGRILPGASVRATFASGRTISFVETFTEPIVVGYHGFDVVINSQGDIGGMIPTFQVLENKAVPLSDTAFTPIDEQYHGVLDEVKAMPDERQARVFGVAVQFNTDLETRYNEALETRRPQSAWLSAVNNATPPISRAKLAESLRDAIQQTEN